MVTLALDPGSSCGWARGNVPEGIYASGVVDLRPKKGQPTGARYAKLWGFLQEHEGIELVAIEQAHHRGGAATEYALGYQAIVKLWAFLQGRVEVEIIHTATVKKHATTYGDANKREMLAKGRDLWGNLPEDEIEARWILDYVLAEARR